MINITGHTGLTGLLGSPVAHSVSPLMHNEAFRYLGLDYVYLCFDVTEETLPQAVEGLKACGIKGFNLTMPNKNKIVELLDELSPTAQLIGAVNTVRNDNGKLKGFNTDGYGFTQSARDAGCDVKGRTITVMGVGGAGMAICGQSDGTLRIPPQAMEEYHIADEGKVYLFTGSKITGGFCVTRKGLLHPSKLGHILDDTPPLLDYSAGSGEFIKYKGRFYCWVEISQEGQILLTKKMMDFLKVRPGMELLSIRSSDIAFTMGAKGPLLEKAENYDGEIPLF